MIATHVTVDNKVTYRLGQTSARGSKIQCLGADGLVHRVCYWQEAGIEAATKLHTSGEDLEYHTSRS